MIYNENKKEISIGIEKVRDGFIVSHHTGRFVTKDLEDVLAFIKNQFDGSDVEAFEFGILLGKEKFQSEVNSTPVDQNPVFPGVNRTYF